MGQPRVCLIVDNPLRDLDGMVLLGWTLALKGAEVFLVPMYQQAFEVAALMPDLVLVNYLRANNQKLVRAYSDSGILVGVLDTEGGIFTSVEEGLTNHIARSDRSGVDLYCLWGKRQYDSFVEHNIFPKSKLYMTGCPRYDFCAEPWKSALPRLGTDDGRMILVNTRFPLICPRFQRGMEDEMNVMLNLGFDSSHVGESVRQYFLVWAEMISVVADLAKNFTKAEFVIRPHPFENRKIYEQVFKDIPNIRITQEKTVLPWIYSSSLLIQKGCSTALEASLLGVQPVSLDWINAPIFSNEIVDSVSHSANSREALTKIVSSALNGHPPIPTPEMNRRKKQLIDDWFCAIDGKSSERVAGAILETIGKSRKNQVKRKPTRIMMYNGLTKAGLRNFAAFFGTRLLGFNRYDGLKSRMLGKPRTISKAFSLQDVRAVTDNLSKVLDNSKPVKVENVRNRHCRLKAVAHCSIRLSV
jgi:surface carbohydrate biosynthesis protein